MSKLTPEKIFKDYQNGDLDKSTIIQYLKSIIEYDKNEESRIKSLEILRDLINGYEDLYEFLENLIVTDSNERIRASASMFLISKYLEKGEKVIKWIIENEKSPFCLASILKSLLYKKNLIKSKELKIDFDYYSGMVVRVLKEVIEKNRTQKCVVSIIKELENNTSIEVNEVLEFLKKKLEVDHHEYELFYAEAVILGIIEQRIKSHIIPNSEKEKIKKVMLKTECFNTVSSRELRKIIIKKNLINLKTFNFWEDLAAEYIEYGLSKRGILIYKIILKVKGEDANILHSMGRAYESIKNYKKAEETYKKSLEIAPNQFDAWDDIAMLYIRTNQPNKAIISLKSLLEYYPDNPRKWWDLYELYKENGDIRNAVNILKTLKVLSKTKFQGIKSWITNNRTFLVSIVENNNDRRLKAEAQDLLKFISI